MIFRSIAAYKIGLIRSQSYQRQILEKNRFSEPKMLLFIGGKTEIWLISLQISIVSSTYSKEVGLKTYMSV